MLKILMKDQSGEASIAMVMILSLVGTWMWDAIRSPEPIQVMVCTKNDIEQPIIINGTEKDLHIVYEAYLNKGYICKPEFKTNEEK